jgi:Collagen triple helix repeat (20 copies)
MDEVEERLDSGGAGGVGPAGPEGPQGPIGPEGPEGPAGPAGADGADGADGAQGPAGNIEIDHQQNTVGASSAAAAAPSYADVPNTTITVPDGDRPVWVEATGLTMFTSVAGARVRLRIVDSDTGADVNSRTQMAGSQATCVSANEHHPIGTFGFRLPANRGATRHFNLQIGTFSGTGTPAATVLAGADYPVSLSAVVR